MSRIKVILWLLPRRLRSSWGLLAISSFGILAAVTLMAVGAIYSRALAEGGLRHTLGSTSPVLLNTEVIVQSRPIGPADYGKLRHTAEEMIDTRLGYMLRETQRYGRAEPNLPLVYNLEEWPPPTDAPLGQPFFLTGFEEHSRIVEGQWPRASPVLHEHGVDLEMAVGAQTARRMGFSVGSQVYLIPFRTDSSQRIAITIVGLAEPIDPREEYWMGVPSVHFSVLDPGQDEPEFVPLYLPEDAFSEGLGTRYPSLLAYYGWLLYLDTGVLTADLVKPTKDAVIGLETDINKRFSRSLVLSRLENTLTDYQRELTYARVPLFIFISLVVLVILYFLAVVMGLLARSRSDEASLLRSRGASFLYVSGLQSIGEGVVVLSAMVLGPFLALGIVRYLLLDTINPAGGSDTLSVDISADMFIMGAIGGFLSLGVLVASGAGLARSGIVEFLRQRARPPSVPLLQRYYIDLVVLVGVGLLWWQIHGRGGFVDRDVLSGALEGDLSLRLGPVLVLLAAALVVLRFFPLLLRLLARAGRLLGPAWVAFALLRIARDPLPHGSLAIILMMAAALGVFGASFQSTLSRSQREQAMYEVGGDLVITSFSRFIPVREDDLAEVKGIQTVSPVARESVILLDGFPGSRATLIAVEPNTLPDTVRFRHDFAGKNLRDLMGSLTQAQDTNQGIELPENAETIGIWVNADDLNPGGFRQTLGLYARLFDARGRYHSLFLGDLPSSSPSPGGPPDQGWTFFEAPLPVGRTFLASHPFTVTSIFVSGDSTTGRQPSRLDLDDLSIKGPSIPTAGKVVEGFELSGMWELLPNPGSVRDTAERSSQAAHSGRFGLSLSWQEPVNGTPRGILIPQGPSPLPVIGGSMFHVGQQLRFKSGKQIVPVVVRDVTDYFPTVYPSSGPFLMVSLEDYTQYTRSIDGGLPKRPGEFWISLDDRVDRGQTVRSVRQDLSGFASVRDRDARVDLAQRNPLAGGGWNGLTILGVSVLTVAVLLAMGTYAVSSVHTGRVDLTVVRALGFSRLQLILSLALERIIVVVLGIAAGSVIGIWLGRWVLGFLDITASGRPVVPPMIVTVQGWLLALVFVDLLVALAVGILLASLLARRLRASDILRTG